MKKIFYSYCHKDKSDKNDLDKCLKTLKDNKLIETWHDQEISPGDEWKKEIDNHLKESDIVLFLISIDFINSENCKQELKNAIKLKKRIIPIILKECSWKDVEIEGKKLSNYQALPDGAKPINESDNKDKEWQSVYEGIKEVVKNKETQLSLFDNSNFPEITEEFKKFLNETELEKLHGKKENLTLEDIFISPDLEKISMKNINEKASSFNYENLIDDNNYNNIKVVSGESQSGKTTLCKKIFQDLYKNKKIPIFLSGNNFKDDNIENLITIEFAQVYNNKFQNYKSNQNLCFIIDDFHLINNKKQKQLIEKIENKEIYLFVDEIYKFENIFNKNVSNSFKIKPFGHKLTNELIKKWIGEHKKDDFEKLDKYKRKVDRFLKGVPSYPFFILTFLSSLEIMNTEIKEEITSYAYCYKTLILKSLKNKNSRNISNDDVKSCLNCLKELAKYIFDKDYKDNIPKNTSFEDTYKNKYIIENFQSIIEHLKHVKLIDEEEKEYFFRHNYIYYYCIAEYLSEPEHYKEYQTIIDKIINNLHIIKNAYITTFLAHHLRTIEFLDEIKLNAMVLFEEFEEIKLNNQEIQNYKEILKEPLEITVDTKQKVIQYRKENLEIQDNNQQIEEKIEQVEENISKESIFVQYIRKSIKTSEVIGNILKDRATSLNKKQVKELLEVVLNLNLRTLRCFLEIIKENRVSFIKLLPQFFSPEFFNISITDNQKEKKYNNAIINLFYNINFNLIISIIERTSSHLGSKTLLSFIIDNFNQTPIQKLINFKIEMLYNKNIPINKMINNFKNLKIIKRMNQCLVKEHLYMHNTTNKEEIINRLGLKKKKNK